MINNYFQNYVCLYSDESIDVYIYDSYNDKLSILWKIIIFSAILTLIGFVTIFLPFFYTDYNNNWGELALIIIMQISTILGIYILIYFSIYILKDKVKKIKFHYLGGIQFIVNNNTDGFEPENLIQNTVLLDHFSEMTINAKPISDILIKHDIIKEEYFTDFYFTLNKFLLDIDHNHFTIGLNGSSIQINLREYLKRHEKGLANTIDLVVNIKYNPIKPNIIHKDTKISNNIQELKLQNVYLSRSEKFYKIKFAIFILIILYIGFDISDIIKSIEGESQSSFYIFIYTSRFYDPDLPTFFRYLGILNVFAFNLMLLLNIGYILYEIFYSLPLDYFSTSPTLIRLKSPIIINQELKINISTDDYSQEISRTISLKENKLTNDLTYLIDLADLYEIPSNKEIKFEIDGKTMNKNFEFSKLLKNIITIELK